MHRPSSDARPVRNPSCYSPTMTLSLELRTTDPMVPMISFVQSSELHQHNDGASFLLFCTGTLHISCLVFFFQKLLVCSSLQRQLCQDNHLPPALVSNWQGMWQMPFLAESIIGGHLFRFPLVWRNRWQANDMCLFCTVTTQ
jgi:hypothetical protein